MNLSRSLDDVCRAALPLEALASLAPLRARPGVRVRQDGRRLWLSWSPGDDEVLRLVLPLRGVELYTRDDESWTLFGKRLPTDGVPDPADDVPLLNVLSPEPVSAQTGERRLSRVGLTIVPDDRARPTSALLWSLTSLVRWAETATTHQLAGLQAAHASGRVLLRGPALPGTLDGERFWGDSVLIPLGRRPEPDLPESVLAAALELCDGAVAMVAADGVEVVPGAAFGPVSRAGVRLLKRETG